MAKQLFISIFLIILSTLCYYIPTMIASSKGIDLKTVPVDYYNHHIWRTSGQFALTAIYAFCFFLVVPEKYLIIKIFSCHLFLMETLSFIIHVISMFFIKSGFSINQIVLTLISFTICCIFFGIRAIYRQKSDIFDPRNTYIIKFLPRTTLGIINHIIHGSGHSGIYQDGKIYKFSKKTGKIEENYATYDYFKQKDIIIKEIPKINGMTKFLGKKYRPIRYNCNKFTKEAQRST